jgi:dTDP-3-amino-2,3,6-trideoxy-4-keto-D-glucose/dTDP-3-amino-3,4,6-trideoxy-alpha-D-glucose/dTDP-2,6-dideoxy-D-kanosamine transaminase
MDTCKVLTKPDLQVPLNDLSRENARMVRALEEAVHRVIARGRYVLGPECDTFEHSFAEYCGARYAVGVANGTDAIELALRAVGISAGNKVATVANAGFYTTAAVLAIGASPVYVEVESQTQLIDASVLAETIQRSKVDGVVATHLFGRLAAVEELVKICARAEIPLIEDCAQAHGAALHGRRAGTFGTAGCFSFYPTKNLGALGDGGAIVTDSDAIAQRVRSLHQYGWLAKYHVTHSGGRNSRLDEIQAAVLLAKLPYLDERNARRRYIACRYTQGISNPKLNCPDLSGEDFVAHLYVVRSQNREQLRTHLDDCGICSDVHYPLPDHKQDALANCGPSYSLPITERLASEVVTLPCFAEMTEEEVELVIAAANKW